MQKFAKFTDPLHGDCSPTSLYQIPTGCTVVPPGGHIHVVDLSIPSSCGNAETEQLIISDPELLTRHLGVEAPTLTKRIFFISQRHPRSALDTTIDLLQPIINHYHVTPFFLDLVCSFTKCVPRREDGYCSPVRTVKGEDFLEICYVYKYAELRPPAQTTEERDPWEIRKTGVYHRLNLKTKQSVWIILSPMPASLGELRITECMQSDTGREMISVNPLYVHAVLISCYLANWRQYYKHIEEPLRVLSERVMTINLDSEFDINHETLRQTNRLKQTLLPLRSSFTALGLTLDTIESVGALGSHHDEGELTRAICNLRNESNSYVENCKYLLHLSDRIRIQTSDVLNLKNQDISAQQNGQLFRLAEASASDSLSIRVITILTLVYLPFSFVATIMSMCFFEMDVSTNRILVSPQIWVFFCVSLPLAMITVAGWRWIMLRKFPLNGRSLDTTSHNSPEEKV